MAGSAKSVRFALFMFLFFLALRFIDDPSDIVKNVVVSAVGAAIAWGAYSLFQKWFAAK